MPERLGGPKRMVQITQSLDDPWFATTVVHVGQAGKECVPCRAVGGQGRHHELETGFPIRVLEAAALLVEDRLGDCGRDAGRGLIPGPNRVPRLQPDPPVRAHGV